MRRTIVISGMAFVYLLTFGTFSQQCLGQSKIQIRAGTKQVGKYEKFEMHIILQTKYKNPFDPDEVDLTVLLKCPNGEQITLPAFYCQNYERRQLNQGRNRANWYYPTGEGVWKVRFAPMATGSYLARARLKDRRGMVESDNIRFECIRSSSLRGERKGFIRTGQKDPRFLEFTEGGPFFAIGQNLAFIGEGQYVNLTKAEEIFGKLSRNGANFVRIWTCCKDWAMAIEARKSAWDRSWHRKKDLIVPIPGSENEPSTRKCVKLEGEDGASITVSPSHPVALRPKTRYILTGQFRADGPRRLRIQLGSKNWEVPFDAGQKNSLKSFEAEFASEENGLWLGRMTLRIVGAGKVFVDKLSLREAAGGGAELLWEADVNRPTRGVYNQLDCFILDQLIEAAERNGIYLMLCVITRDLYMKSLSNEKSPEYEQAIEDAKNFMRYAVARWGYSTNVAAWEYFNEINPGLPTDRFYTELGKYLERIDIYRHLRTTSTWHPSAKDCQHHRLDIGQLHHYMRPGTKEDFKDEVAVVIDRTQFLRRHAPSKPVLIGEFGLATPKWGLSEHMKQDTEGVHFHNSLWASAFAGSSGTTMFWWWDQLDRQENYGHYRPLAAFLADASFSGLSKIRATSSKDELRLLGYQGNDRAYAWIFNPQATWWNLVIQGHKPEKVQGTIVEIQGLRAGSYRVEWWDTHKGKVIREDRASCTQGQLRVSIPSFSRDIACKINH